MSNNVMKWCRYLAGSMFAITALGDLVYMIPEHFSLSMLMIILANLLMSISMFAEILPMFAAGSGVFALNNFITLFSSGNILYAILGTAAYVLAFLYYNQ